MRRASRPNLLKTGGMSDASFACRTRLDTATLYRVTLHCVLLAVPRGFARLEIAILWELDKIIKSDKQIY